MKILFVCRANVARSQVAQAAFELVSRHECASAGTHVDDEVAEDPWERCKLKDWSHHAVPYMLEHGADIDERDRTQLTPKMAAAVARVVVILPARSGPPTWPRATTPSSGTSLIPTTRRDPRRGWS